MCVVMCVVVMFVNREKVTFVPGVEYHIDIVCVLVTPRDLIHVTAVNCVYK